MSHQNYVEALMTIRQKVFNILAINLSVLHNHVNGSSKIILRCISDSVFQQNRSFHVQAVASYFYQRTSIFL